jgi:hypothetical protein
MMFKSDQLPPAKLIIGRKEFVTGDKTKLKLVGVKQSPGANAILMELEITKDPDLFQLLVNAAEQRNVKVQFFGREFMAELAIRNSYPGPPFSGKITIRQCSQVRKT